MSIKLGAAADNWTAKVVNPDGQSSSATGFAVLAPVSQAPTERLSNGSFTSGQSPWISTGNFWVGNLANYRSSPGYAAGGVDTSGSPINSANGSLYQTVTIPSNSTSANLSFWFNITSQETSGAYDYLKMKVQNSSGVDLSTDLVVLSNQDKSTGYSQRSVDLTSYRGQTIRIYFSATSDSSNYTIFRIDDVSLMADGN
ncbi:MAG: choice-of-anchor J domain-containing protein [Candidatus Riflebacteria bacterium]|nr:choice-of-anchor J domain-containing protein [Candidatus Riflebacteria bacterium]